MIYVGKCFESGQCDK